MKNQEEKMYKCENCGGVMEFDVKSQGLKCPNCAHEVPIFNDETSIVEHTLTKADMKFITVEEKTSSTMECKNCGAVIEVDATSTATSCPYCGSHIVLAEKQVETIVPDGVLPFQIDKNQVGSIFRKWIKGRWFAPNALKHLYQQDKIQGLYLPFWTFDAQASCDYSAMGGRDRQVTTRNSKGETETRIVTDWFPTHGHIEEFFDDILVKASIKVEDKLMGGIEVYNTQGTKSYSPDYLSGFSSEVYSIGLEEAYETGIEKMKDKLRNIASRQVLSHYDHVRDIHIHPHFSNQTYKHVLVPVYSTAYAFKEKTYKVLINGQTGTIKGDYPKSPIKIALAILAALILIGGIFFLSQREKESDTVEPQTVVGCITNQEEDSFNTDKGEIVVRDTEIIYFT